MNIGWFLIVYFFLKELFKIINRKLDIEENKPRHAKEEKMEIDDLWKD